MDNRRLKYEETLKMTTALYARLQRAPAALVAAVTLVALMAPIAMPSLATAASEAPDATAPSAAGPAAVPAKPPAASVPGAPKNDDDKTLTLYTLGVLISRSVDSFQLTPAEFKSVMSGLADGYNHHVATIDIDAYTQKVQALHSERVAVVEQHDKDAGQAYLEKAAAAPGAQKTQTGIVYLPLTEGTGASPSRTDRVTVHYEGKLLDGTVFDSSIKRGQPASFSLGAVIPCWTEALQLMKVGGKSRIVCPAILAYGERGNPPVIRPGSTLVFEVQLLSIASPPPATQSPMGPPMPPTGRPPN
jgi:FKBP-type peptidyl-prolyl cis-trans isomerase FkpA